MKKLLFTLGAFACAASVQAAAYNWANFYPVDAYGQPQDAGYQESGTMYLINEATTIDLGGGNMQALTQTYFIETVLAAGANYESVFNNLVANAENSAGLTDSSHFSGTPKKGSTDGNGHVSWATEDSGSQSFYQVLIDTDNKGIYISELFTATVDVSGDTKLAFENPGAYDEFGVGSNPYPIGTSTFIGDGWYTAAPEPTSGLLLLFGLAGLALKRKRV